MVNMRMDSPPLIPGNSENMIQATSERSPSETLPDPASDAGLQRLSVCRLSNSNSNNSEMSPRSGMEQEKRIRREIANSNERRRMQSINQGFQSLRALLPKRDGEKMSKASILQQTADYIGILQAEKMQLAQQNLQFKQALESRGQVPVVVAKSEPCAPLTVIPPPKKRRKYESHINDTSEEGGASSSEESRIPSHCPPPTSTDETESQRPMWEMDLAQKQLTELRLALDRERRMRVMLEDQLRSVELSSLQTLGRLSQVPTLADFTLSTTSFPSATYTQTATTSLLTPLMTMESHSSNPTPPQSHNSRQSLEVIVEAIRHLEGDHPFAEKTLLRLPDQDSGISSPVSDKVLDTASHLFVSRPPLLPPSMQ